jgi:hypothetical protein
MVTQLSFLFMNRTQSVVVKLVPRDKLFMLDFGIYDLFRNVACLTKFADRLERVHIYAVGQLVQMSEADLREYSFVSDETITAIKDELSKSRLSLGMAAPSWTRSHRSLLRVASPTRTP